MDGYANKWTEGQTMKSKEFNLRRKNRFLFSKQDNSTNNESTNEKKNRTKHLSLLLVIYDKI